MKESPLRTASPKADNPILDPVIEAYKRDVDRTLLRRNLTLTVEQRLLQLAQLQRAAAELRRAGQRADP